MTVPIIVLRDDVRTQIQNDAGITIENRRAPYLSAADVASGKWILVTAGDDQAIAGRQVDRTTLTIDLAWQIKLPDKSATVSNPLEDEDFFESQMQAVETVKNLFRGGGTLRDTRFSGGFDFLRFTNSPIYRPDMLIEHQIFTSVIRLEFLGEVEAV